MEAWFLSRASPSEVCGRKAALGMTSFRVLLFLSVSIIPPVSYTASTCYCTCQKDKQAKAENHIKKC